MKKSKIALLGFSPPPSRRCALALLATTCASSVVCAQQSDWINPSGGNYQTAANWSPLGIPPAANTIRFNLNNTYSVNLTADATAAALSVNNGTISFLLGNNTLTLTSGSNFIGNSTVRVSGGEIEAPDLSVGFNVGTAATLALNSGADVIVGGGVFTVGTGGTGNVSLAGGATLTTAGTATLGANASAVGTVTVGGTGSSWTATGPLRVGAAGTGTLNIESTGTVAASTLEIAESPGSIGTVTVSGANSQLTVTGTVRIGGSSALSPGASAVLSISPGATVSFGGATTLRTVAAVNVSGGTWNLNTLNVDPGATVNWSAGTVRFANASSITPAVLDLLLGGTHTIGLNRTLAATDGDLALTTSLSLPGGTLTARNIDINAGVSVGAFGSLQATETMVIQSGKTVVVEDFGTVSADLLFHNNGGTLQLNGPNAIVSKFFANNFGYVQGTGRFAGGLNNGTGGTIRALAGHQINIDGIGQTNPGRIELAGGTIQYSHALSNLGNGIISGHGVFRGSANSPGGNALSNLGVVALSGGNSEFHGDVNNATGGRIVTTGGSVTTFFDDVTHNGAEIRTSAESSTVILGGLSGAGPFTGTGTVYLEGDLKPGNSAAAVTFEGDLVLGGSSELTIEIGGLQSGTQHDRVSVAGTLEFGGTFRATLTSGFLPQSGDVFNVLDFNGRAGNFSMLDLPNLPGTLEWDASRLQSDGTLAVVPEPGSLTLCLAGIGLLLTRRRQTPCIR